MVVIIRKRVHGMSTIFPLDVSFNEGRNKVVLDHRLKYPMCFVICDEKEWQENGKPTLQIKSITTYPRERKGWVLMKRLYYCLTPAGEGHFARWH